MQQKLLIADDSTQLHTLVKTQLEPDSLACHSAYDGEAAIALAATIQPDLILLDVDMPRLDGFEVCRRLKANPLTGDIPVIFLTADSMLNDSVRGLDCGAIDYIAKPFRPEDLRARVRSALRLTRLTEETRMIDGATGLWNKTYFDLQLKSQLSLSRRLQRPLACIVAEIGAEAGPEILHLVGDLLREKCRAEDTICRFEGGKFVVLLSCTDRRVAARLAERLLHEMERQLRQHGEQAVCSLGVSDSLNCAGESLLQRADAAGFQARQLGRNCVSIARDPPAMSEA
jgi:diguanylate cyclase (GGDEF)-like protein